MVNPLSDIATISVSLSAGACVFQSIIIARKIKKLKPEISKFYVYVFILPAIENSIKILIG